MATTLNSHATVGELVTERPQRSRVFERLGIDYCCGGKKSLAEVCAAKGYEADQVLSLIEESDASQSTIVIDAATMALTELCDHIEQTHHAYLKTELPRLDAMTHKVAAVHGADEPRLVELRETFIRFRDELMMHMQKEEHVLFPIIRSMESGDLSAGAHCGSVANPIAQMEAEHDDAGEALEAFRRLTDAYTPPAWACNTFRATYDALAQLERDMHQHVHKENNVLFPRAIKLERQGG
ncbi:iron-sulfur cluster repair di-iron protein [Planctomycetales bacterium ZRK34]|nr:iron-sulfur cluster repair di-iron protein [Planctomycetales bacterium ZRK34]